MAPPAKPVVELEKPSLLKTSKIFASINVLIIEKDSKLAILIKKILFSLGCKQIYVVSDGREAIKLMHEEAVDIIICEWDIKGLNGVDMAAHLRQSLDSPNRTIPIVMLTARNERHEIEAARDAGITEYLIKPFSARTLLMRMHEIVENPRNFIICKTFVGPDRRRLTSMTLPPESRIYVERKPAVIVPKYYLQQMILDEVPRMIMPDYSLKHRIGMEVPPEALIDEEALEQTAIADADAEFIRWLMNDVQTLETALQTMMKDGNYDEELIEQIKDAAYSIKSRAGTFGYTRASDIAGSLYDFCNTHYDRANTLHLSVLEKHMQALITIFSQNIAGDGGKVGEELMQDLHKLIQKYLKA